MKQEVALLGVSWRRPLTRRAFATLLQEVEEKEGAGKERGRLNGGGGGGGLPLHELQLFSALFACGRGDAGLRSARPPCDGGQPWSGNLPLRVDAGGPAGRCSESASNFIVSEALLHLALRGSRETARPRL